MGPYHIVLTHFPIALWSLAMLVILWRVVSSGSLAQRLDHALVPLLTVALLSGLGAYATGTQVWPWESISASPLGRNHLMMAAWTVVLWAVVWWLRWRRGEAVWAGALRWAMAVLALLGGGLLAVTGTLGGHLTNAPTDLSELLRRLGWEVYSTFYVPNLTVGALGAFALLCVLLGLWARRAGSSSAG
ncbi:MAG: heme ABC transporter permease [Burkholderiales bacterium]|nr:heme ABC transporter permease [Burkholderiales bacterium]MBK8666065.1 heme ABC transporter permease [Burkholderiales bacterium]